MIVGITARFSRLFNLKMKAKPVAFLLFIYIECVTSRCEKSFVVICDSLLDVQYNTTKKTWTELLIQQDIYEENAPKYTLTNKHLGHELSNLKWLIIHNHLKEISSRSFTYCKSLRHLILYGNSLESIKSGTFFAFRQLLKLGLENNNIKEIEENAFRSTTSEVVDLSYNRIEVLRRDVFKKCHVTTLTITHNKLWRIETNSLPADLKNLHLDYNSFEALPYKLNSLQQLQQLTISHNDLVTASGLSGLEQLTTLDLSFNRISYITDELDNVENLKYLDLSSNLLEKFTFTEQFIANLGKLKEHFSLLLAHNQLRKVNPAEMRRVRAFEVTITLSGNPWSCSCIEQIQKIINHSNITTTDCDQQIFSSGQHPYCIIDNADNCSEVRVSDSVISDFRNSFKNKICDVFGDIAKSVN